MGVRIPHPPVRVVDLEGWPSGLRRRGANADNREVPEVRILHPPLWFIENRNGLFRCHSSAARASGCQPEGHGFDFHWWRNVDLAQAVEHGFETPAVLVQVQRSTLMVVEIAPVVHRQNATVPRSRQWVRPPPGARGYAVITQAGRVAVFQTANAGSIPAHCYLAVVAQRAEQPSRKRQVDGSRPSHGSSGFGSVAQRQSAGLISPRMLVRLQPPPTVCFRLEER